MGLGLTSAVVFARLITGLLMITLGTGGITGTGGAALIGSGSFFVIGVNVKPLKWPQKSLPKGVGCDSL